MSRQKRKISSIKKGSEHEGEESYYEYGYDDEVDQEEELKAAQQGPHPPLITPSYKLH